MPPPHDVLHHVAPSPAQAIATRLPAERIDLSARSNAVARLPTSVRSGLPSEALDLNARGSTVRLLTALHADSKRLRSPLVYAQTLRRLQVGMVLRNDRCATAAALVQLQHRLSGMPTIRSERLQAFSGKGAATGLNQSLPAAWLRGGADAMRAVARVAVRRHENGAPMFDVDGSPWRYHGTAWLIAPDLLLTNFHVVRARDEAESPPSGDDLAQQVATMEVQFDVDAEGDDPPPLVGAKLEQFAPVDGHDYALLRLPVAPVGRTPMRLAPDAVTSPMDAPGAPAANIIEHPQALWKVAAVRNNLIAFGDERELWYYTDTDAGSSGSPVFNDAWQVIGLHTASATLSNGEVVNTGTPLVQIYKDLVTKDPTLKTQIHLG